MERRRPSWTAGVLAGGVFSALLRKLFFGELEPIETAGEDAGGPRETASMLKPHLGWRSRGYLPHCDEAGLVQHIVFGLADAMPRGASNPSVMHADRALDAGHGSCLLKDARCAKAVEDVLLHADGERFRLIAWCVMPNHVHVVAEEIFGFPLGDIVQGWKSTASHAINDMLGRRGRLWRREYFDRFMRDDDHLSTTIAYVEHNPVKAGLTKTAADWPGSSAWRRETAGEDAGGPR